MSICDDISPTALPDLFLESEVAAQAARFIMPRYADIPQIPLYRDQVIAYIDHVFEPLSFARDGEWLTPSMVNNYVKSKVIPAPEKKQYGREHIAQLIMVCIFKQFLSIAEITRLFGIQQTTYPIEVAYDYAATEVEGALHSAFLINESMSEDTASIVTRESLLVRSAAAAFASKAYLLGYLHFIGLDSQLSS